MKNATIYRPSGRNRTCGPVIPVQRSNQLLYRVDLDSYRKCIKFTLEISIYKIPPPPPGVPRFSSGSILQFFQHLGETGVIVIKRV